MPCQRRHSVVRVSSAITNMIQLHKNLKPDENYECIFGWFSSVGLNKFAVILSVGDRKATLSLCLMLQKDT